MEKKACVATQHGPTLARTQARENCDVVSDILLIIGRAIGRQENSSLQAPVGTHNSGCLPEQTFRETQQEVEGRYTPFGDTLGYANVH